MVIVRKEASENNVALEWTSTVIVFGAVFCLIMGIFKRFRASMTFQNDDMVNAVQVQPTYKPATFRFFNEDSFLLNTPDNVRSSQYEEPPKPPPQRVMTVNEKRPVLKINGESKSINPMGSVKTLNKTLTSGPSKTEDETPKVLKISDDLSDKPTSSKDKKKKDDSKKDKKSSKDKDKDKKSKEKKKKKDKDKKEGKDDLKKLKKEEEKKKKKEEEKKKKDELSKAAKNKKNNDNETLPIDSATIEITNNNNTAINKARPVSNEYEEVGAGQENAFSSSWDMVAEHRRNLKKEVKFQPPATNLREMAMQKKMNENSTPSRNPMSLNPLAVGGGRSNIQLTNSDEESDTNA